MSFWVAGHTRIDATIERVRVAIAQLPSGQREVVELHKLQGMSMAQVSQRLQIREGAARVRAHRGYKALARLLGAGLWPFLMLTNPTFDSPGVGSDENGFGHRAKVTSAATPADLQPRERWGVLGAWRR